MSEKQYDSWKEFFEACDVDTIQIISYGGSIEDISIEEIFQYFKQRIVDEIKTEHGDLVQDRKAS